MAKEYQRYNRGKNDNRQKRSNQHTKQEKVVFDDAVFNANYKNWIQNKIDEKCIQFMEYFGLVLCDKSSKDAPKLGYNAVTTSQMRNIFSEVKRIEVKLSDDDKWEAEQSKVLLLRPKIAYNTARVISNKRDSKIKDLRTVLEKCLIEVRNKEDFKRFSQVLEGIIAYHKVYGGKD